MRKVSNQMRQLLAANITNLHTCFLITRKDGVLLGFCEGQADINLDGVLYKAMGAASLDEIKNSNKLGGNKADIIGVLSHDDILEKDIDEGGYDDAYIEVFLADPENISAGKINLHSGYIEQINYGDGIFTASLSGLSKPLENTIGQVYSPMCRAYFGDRSCKMNLENYQHEVVVINSHGQKSFEIAEANFTNDYFAFGVVTFLGGSHQGRQFEIASFNNGLVTLSIATGFDIEEGEAVILTVGCDKNFATCCNKFNNAINFRGESGL